MGVAGLIFKPHPPDFQNQDNFWRWSNDISMIFWYPCRLKIFKKNQKQGVQIIPEVHELTLQVLVLFSFGTRFFENNQNPFLKLQNWWLLFNHPPRMKFLRRPCKIKGYCAFTFKKTSQPNFFLPSYNSAMLSECTCTSFSPELFWLEWEEVQVLLEVGKGVFFLSETSSSRFHWWCPVYQQLSFLKREPHWILQKNHWHVHKEDFFISFTNLWELKFS